MADEPDTSEPHDGLEQAEREYFESRGEKTDGLDSSPAPTSDPAAAAPPAQTALTPPETVPAVAPDSGDDEGVETFTAADGKEQRRVNYPKYLRVEARAKAAETALASERERFARVDERLKLINEALSTPAQQQEQVDDDPEPDPQQDIFAHSAWTSRRLARANEQIAAFHEERRLEREQGELTTWYRTEAEKFAAKTAPDLGMAYNYLINNRLVELEAYGVSDPAERLRMVLAEERDLAMRAKKDGVSPAERLYNLAKGRGYVRQEPAAPNGNGNNVANPVASQHAAPAVPGSLATPPAKPSVTEEIERLKAGQAASLSLSNVGGAPGDQLTPEVLANMSDDEFKAVFNKLQSTGNKEKLRQLMGA